MGGSLFSILSCLIVGGLLSKLTARHSNVLLWRPFAAPDVEEILRLVAAGQVRPIVDRRYRLDEIAQALR